MQLFVVEKQPKHPIYVARGEPAEDAASGKLKKEIARDHFAKVNQDDL